MAEYIKHRDSRIFGTIDTQRWQELQKQGISPEGMYLLTELLVGRFRNSVGVIYIPFPLATLAKITGLEESTVTGAFRELEEKGLLEFDQDNEVIFLKEYWRHNSIASVKHSNGASVRIMELPQNNLFRSMARLFKQCLQEAREYDKRFPPGVSDRTGERYSTVHARYEPVFKAIMERIEDTPIDTPINTPIDTPIDTTDTDTDTDTETDTENKNDNVAQISRNHETVFKEASCIFGDTEEIPRAKPGIQYKNYINLGKVQNQLPEELVSRAKRFIPVTSSILSHETWKEQTQQLLMVDESELDMEQLDEIIERFMEKHFSKANDKSIVLFNDPNIKMNLANDIGII